MTTAQVVQTSVTVNNNSPIQDYVHPDDQTQPFEMTPGFKPFTIIILFTLKSECIFFRRDAETVDLEKCSKAIQVSEKMKGVMYFT